MLSDEKVLRRFERIKTLDNSFLKKESSSFAIHNFMISEMGLTKNELIIFAYIYSFPEHRCTFSTYKIGYILNIHPRRVQPIMIKLIEEGYITKIEYKQRKVLKREYIANRIKKGEGKNDTWR